MELAPVTKEMLQSQLKGLAHARTRAGAVGTLLLLLSRGVDDALLPLMEPYIPQIAELLDANNAGGDGGDASAQPNAAAVLGAAASMSDALNRAVDAAAVSREGGEHGARGRGERDAQGESKS